MRASVLMVCIFTLVFAGDAMAGCSKTAEGLYDTAISITGTTQADFDHKVELLKQAERECKNFNIYYELARAYNRLDKMEQVEQSLLDAYGVAGNDREQLKFHTFIGLVYENLGREEDALFHFRKAYDKGADPAMHKKIKEIEIQRMNRGMEVGEIQTALLSTKKSHKAFGGTKGWGVKPSIQLYINFEYNDWHLSDPGRSQAEKLGKALTCPAFAQERFLIIGHTDSIGSDAFNMELSQKRARTVVDFLAQQFSLKNLTFEGRGERELKYPGEKNNEEQALNRRVEVCIKSMDE